MKTSLITTLITAAILSAAAWVSTAQEHSRTPHLEPGKTQRHDAGPRAPLHAALPLVIGALDADNDRIISAGEIEKATESLKAIDKNGDGQLTDEEFMGAPRRLRHSPLAAKPDESIRHQ
jgi:hypothetical protein